MFDSADYRYVEQRLYPDPGLVEAANRLKGKGEIELAKAVAAEQKRHEDAMFELRQQLNARMKVLRNVRSMVRFREYEPRGETA